MQKIRVEVSILVAIQDCHVVSQGKPGEAGKLRALVDCILTRSVSEGRLLQASLRVEYDMQSRPSPAIIQL